jgi:hypothetical protein
MNLKKRTWVVTCAVISTLAITVSLSAAQDAQHEQSSATPTANQRTIRGAWRTVVTPRNCQTGDAILTLAGLFHVSTRAALIAARAEFQCQRQRYRHRCATAVGTRL